MKYDLIIIGGGPAGMMAAGKAGSCGAQVLLLEKNPSLGVKLLLTGGNRCNLTNNSFEPKKMAEQYGNQGKFLISSLTRFSPDDVMDFFRELGLKIKIEEKGKVFPRSDRSADVLAALKQFLKMTQVEIRYRAEVKKLIKKGKRIEKIFLADGQELTATQYIVATGGKSYPATGSTGEGYAWLKALGHKVIEPAPVLCAFFTKGALAGRLQGLSLRDIEIGAWKKGKKIGKSAGDLIFTESGLSGPAIFNLSRAVGEALPGEVKIKIDLFPDKETIELEKMLAARLATNNKKIKNILAAFLPAKLASELIKLSGFDDERVANLITKAERQRLVGQMKDFEFDVLRLDGFNKAMVTAGGVDLKEVDPKTMKSKIIENLYFAGEILNIDGPTGGFNLQAAWSTGWAAGEAAALV